MNSRSGGTSTNVLAFSHPAKSVVMSGFGIFTKLNLTLSTISVSRGRSSEDTSPPRIAKMTNAPSLAMKRPTTRFSRPSPLAAMKPIF